MAGERRDHVLLFALEVSDEATYARRVFPIGSSDRAAKESFFADAGYRAVRAELFETSVARVHLLGRIVPEGSFT